MDYNYKMVIAYDGGRYEGFQRQRGRLTIQETLESFIQKVSEEDVKIIASGRTDAGVHAKGQTVNFHIKKKLEEAEFKQQLNEELPEDLKIIKIEQVASGFHSRFDALSKTYCYTVDLRKRPCVFTRRYAYSVTEELDIEKMRKAVGMLIGVHDFRSFSSEKRKEKDTVRNLQNIDIVLENEYLKLYFTGEGFLYHMVRILTGTLIEIGLGKIDVQELPEIFRAKSRYCAGFMAPAHGLTLIEVRYPS